MGGVEGSPGERAELNLIERVRSWSRAAGGHEWSGPGFICVSNPVKKRAFNHIFVLSPDVDADELCDGVARFTAADLPVRVRVRPEVDAETDALTQAGLVFEAPMQAMSFSGPMALPTSLDLLIERVDDARKLADLRAVIGGAFDWTEEQLAPIFHEGALDTAGWFAWIGYAGSEPVVSSQLLVYEATGGLYHIATAEPHRRRGYGEAITRVSVHEGNRQGCDVITLYASELGYPVYSRLGFTDAGELLTYQPATG
jgi:hypothetical protein